jgi:magnesium-transporting ATPase (P-type)
MDPLVPNIDAISMAHGAGVRIVHDLVTTRTLLCHWWKSLLDKDHSSALTGPEMDHDGRRIASVAPKFNIFARASPQEQIRIVKGSSGGRRGVRYDCWW